MQISVCEFYTIIVSVLYDTHFFMFFCEKSDKKNFVCQFPLCPCDNIATLRFYADRRNSLKCLDFFVDKYYTMLSGRQ